MDTWINMVLMATYFLSLYFAIFWFLVFLDKNPAPKKKEFNGFPTVSIVVPAYNEEKVIHHSLNSLVDLDYPRDKFKIFVVNDGSTDNTRAIAEEFIKNYNGNNVFLINKENGGKATALNHILRNCDTEYFVCLDADSSVEKSALKKTLPYFTEDDIASVLPCLKVKEPKNILQKMQWLEYIINMFYKYLMGVLHCIHVAPGPFSVYKTSILKKVGDFEVGNITEDLEMAIRLQSHHYKLIQILDVDVHTVSPNNMKELYKQRNRWFKGALQNAYKYKKMLFNKNYGDFGMIQMPTIFLAAVLATVIVITAIYYSAGPYFDYMINFSHINFDIWTLLKNFTLNISILDLNFTNLLLGSVTIFITMTIFIYSLKHTNETIKKVGIPSLICYILFYFILMGGMWIGVLIDMILGKNQKW